MSEYKSKLDYISIKLEHIKGIFDSSEILIPRSQRNYEWNTDNCRKWIDDLFNVYEESEYKYYIGQIIVYKNININEIWDGQQRLTTLYLTLLIMSKITDNVMLKTKILNKLVVDELVLSNENLRFKNKYKYDLLPILRSLNLVDYQSLCKILNGKFISYCEYLEFKDNKFVCKKCKKHLKRFKEHVITCNNLTNIYTSKNKKNLLLRAYDSLYLSLLEIKNKINKNVVLFALGDIQFTVVQSSVLALTSSLFEWQNTRGLPVTVLNILKTKILGNFQAEDVEEYHKKWDYYYERFNRIDSSKSVEKIFTVAIQILLKNFIDYKLDIVMEKMNNTCYNDIFNILENLYMQFKKLYKLKYGKLLFKENPILVSIEVFEILGCYIHKFGMDNVDEIINIITKFHFRNACCYKSASIGQLEHMNPIRKLCQGVINDEIKDVDFKQHLISIFNKSYERNKIDKLEKLTIELLNKNFKNKFARQLLTFIEYNLNNDNIGITTDDNSLEHIIPQSSNHDNIYLLGNMTLLEFKNSENGHKGNASIQDVNYKFKVKKSYEGSNFRVTHQLINNYRDFTTDDIEKRTVELAGMIFNMTKL